MGTQTGSILIDFMTTEGIINLQSSIWNQFNSPLYNDMLRYSWRHTDPNFDYERDLMNNPPQKVKGIQFTFDKTKKCEVEGCENPAFIKWSHCGKLLCLHHFMYRTSVHNHESEFSREHESINYDEVVYDDDE